jgi:hypothetical protein
MLRNRFSFVVAGALAAVVALGSCALQGEAEREAQRGAPTLDGLGNSTFVVSARHDDARRWFGQGLLLLYAFQHDEAARSFRAAYARDPSCAMCAWGVALALGPNINQPERQSGREIRLWIRRAQAAAAASPVTPLERDLIGALAVRYDRGEPRLQRETVARGAAMCSSRKVDRTVDPLELAYAQAMTDVRARYPDDPDVATLFADAVMTTSPWDWWDRSTGAPIGAMGQVVDVLEAATRRHPQHTGAAHFLIHAAEQSPAPRRALAAADGLRELAPGAPHLVHMASHIYVHVERFAAASAVNEAALAAQQGFDGAIRKQGFSVSWNWDFHHLHFLWYAALQEGRGDLAVGTARRIAERFGGARDGFGEYARSLPWVTLARLARWDEVLREPAPTESLGLVEAAWRHARAHARLAGGDAVAARREQAELAQLLALPTLKRAQLRDAPLPLDMARLLDASVRAELALRAGEPAAAVEAAQVMVEVDDYLEGEPPWLAVGGRTVLARAQLAAGRAAEAEATLREHERRSGANAATLRVLVQALEAQNKTVEAAAARARLKEAARAADAALGLLAEVRG